MYLSFRGLVEDGLLVVTTIGNVVYRHYGADQPPDANFSHGGIAQAAIAHHTPFRYHSH